MQASRATTAKTRFSARRGATVLEVMFAIFVAVVGLMGIASLLPMAARNADQSNASNNAITQGKIWLNDFVARGLNDPDRYARTGTGFNWLGRDDTQVPATFVSFTKVANQSVCIDPLFMSDVDVVRRFNDGSSFVNGYRASLFPYFAHNSNPMTDPAAAMGANDWVYPGANGQPQGQPRMNRLTLGGGAGQIPALLSKGMFQSNDDLSTAFLAETSTPFDARPDLNSNDKALPASRLFGPSGKHALNGDYSWFATLSPELSLTPSAPTDEYILSVVVMRKRDKQFWLHGSQVVGGSEENKPGGERLVWVQPLSGDFQNGVGGRVRLVSNANTNSSIHVGDWIMFSKVYAFTPAPANAPLSVFRWFRVVAADADPTIDVIADSNPFLNGDQPASVWAREVSVEGSDWVFFSTRLPNPTEAIGNIPVPTTGTVVSNVVTVLERRVSVE